MNARRAIVLLAALLAASGQAAAQQKRLTIDDIFDPVRQVDFGGSVPSVTWLPDGRSYLTTDASGALRRVDAASGRDEPFFDAARFEKAIAALDGVGAERARQVAASRDFTYDAAYSALLFTANDDLYVFDLKSGRAARLTNAPGEETNASFSPDGKMVAFVRNSDLYAVDVAGGAERALTTGGGPNHLNGRLDWVYEEELYGRGETTAYWWSPDSSTIAYLSLDETNVPAFVIPDDIPRDQSVEMTRYPQVADPNPGARIGVVAASGGESRWVDLSAYDPADLLVVRVGWRPDSARVVYELQNRVQTWLELLEADPATGKPARLLRDESKTWVDVNRLPFWLEDKSFVWQSDRGGYCHLYHYGPGGELLGAVTKGEWDVREVYGTAGGWVYFKAAEHSPLADHVYRAKVDGSGFERLSKAEGDHDATFNPTFTSYVDTWSDVATPPRASLFDATGKLVRVIAENKVAALAEYRLGKPEFVHVPARDGFVMEAMLIKPPDFDPSKKYPVVAYTYAGPGAQVVRNDWGGKTYLWHQYLADHGYLVWALDNRQASAKGVITAWTSFHNFGEPELRDLEDGVAWLRSQPWVDSTRIGMWGWSFGGYMTAFALTHSTSFKVGIAGAPVTDWRNYDSIYTERYMGLPTTNPEGYERSSVIRAAANLHGRLLLIHGAVDNNVHSQNSLQLIDALQKAGVQFDFMLYPQSRHGVTNPYRVKHLRQLMAEYLFKNL